MGELGVLEAINDNKTILDEDEQSIYLNYISEQLEIKYKPDNVYDKTDRKRTSVFFN